MKLGVISIEVVFYRVGVGDGGQGGGVKSEKNRAKDRSLRNTTCQIYRLRVSAIDENSLFSVR